jgi:hypothetical protein
MTGFSPYNSRPFSLVSFGFDPILFHFSVKEAIDVGPYRKEPIRERKGEGVAFNETKRPDAIKARVLKEGTGDRTTFITQTQYFAFTGGSKRIGE